MDMLAALCVAQGFFTRGDARDAGYDDKAIAAAARSGLWLRFRRGYYTLGVLWTAMDDVERHRVRSAAVVHSLGDSVVLSHVSASVAHGLDIWGIPLDRVHVTRLDGGAGRLEGDVVHHTGRALDDDITVSEGRPVMRPVRAAIEAVGRSSGEVALAHFDSLLRCGLAHPDELMNQFMIMERWPFTQHLHLPVRMADPRSQSVGESRGIWFFFRHGVPAPVPQFEVRAADGTLLGTCDWGWPHHGLLGEFDGQTKYSRLLRPGQDPGSVVFAEKHREDAIREETGRRMIRIVWSDYDRPRLLLDRLNRMLRKAD
ncbi:MAG: hypothetical protein JWO76_2211 [Nocardioides sp.]|nr:hypothetical protein [Nocardioides sp.]